MYAMKNIHFEKDQRKNRKNNETGGKKEIAMCTFTVSHCVFVWVCECVDVNHFECGQRMCSNSNAELFGKFAIKDKPREMEARLSVALMQWVGLAKWIGKVAKSINCQHPCHFHSHTTVSVSVGVSVSVCVRTWKASFDWKCRLGGDIELMEVNRCDAKNFPISRQLTALSIWLGLRINKGALRKQAKLDIKKWGYKNGYTLGKYTQQRLPTKGGEYFPCSANKYWNVDISVCSEVSVVFFSNVVNW